MSIRNNTDRLHVLLGKDQWTEEEQLWLLHYLNSTRHSELRDMLQDKFEKDSINNQPDAKAEQLLILIQEKIDLENKKENTFYFNNWKRIMIAASVILILCSGVLSYIYHRFRALSLVPLVLFLCVLFGK